MKYIPKFQGGLVLPKLDFNINVVPVSESTFRANPKLDYLVSTGEVVKEPIYPKKPLIDNIYKVKRGDSFTKISRDTGIDMATLKNLNPQVADINKIFVGQKLNLGNNAKVKTSSVSNTPSFHTVSSGESLSSIAKKYKTNLGNLLKSNSNIKDPNKIFIGQKINVSKPSKPLVEILLNNTSFTEQTPYELENLNRTLSNLDKIHEYEAISKTPTFYVIEDKQRHTATVYKQGKAIQTFNTATGKNKGDDLTVTTTGGKGKDAPLISGAGNMSTPAGMFRISSTGKLKGYPTFQRSKIHEDYNIPSSVHIGAVPLNKTQCNRTNGCTNLRGQDLKALAKYVFPGTKWYILPESDELGYFNLTGGGISFISKDINRLHSEHIKGYRDISFGVSPDVSHIPAVKIATNVLSTSKKKLVDRAGIPSDTYDKLALLALGIMGRESQYNNPGLKGQLGFLKDNIGANVLNKNVSIGPYQLRESSVPKDLLKKLNGTTEVNYNTLKDPATSTELIMLSLYDIYKNIAPRYLKKYPDLSLEEITAAYYANPAGVINPEKADMRIPYAKTVLGNTKKFFLNYK